MNQLYLKCEYCDVYFKHTKGKRKRWCSPKCKMAAWRKLKKEKQL